MIGKSFESNFLESVESEILNRKKLKLPLVAAFDADGTLWHTDASEIFFEYTIHNNLCSLPPNPLHFYQELKKVGDDPKIAYLWLAQIYINQNIHDVRDWAQKALQTFDHSPVFKCQSELIQLLQKHNVTIYIVTASITWAVEPFAALLNIPKENVLGFETSVINSKVSVHPIHRATYKKGKAEALLKQTQGQKPFLCSGNSLGDVELLEISEKFHITISASEPSSELGQNEAKLRSIAKSKGWTVFKPLE